MKFRYLTAALAFTAMAACTNEEFASYESAPNAVRISATVGSLNEARSNPIGDNTTGFNPNDRISITSNGKTVVYTLTAEGWSPESGYLTWGSEEPQLFTAHYPADWDGETLSVEPDQSDLTNLQLSDRMSFSDEFTKQDAISLTMKRLTARVVISNEITWNDEYKDANGNVTREVKEIKINGIVPFQYKETTATDKNYYALLVPTSVDKTGIFMTITIWDGNDENTVEPLTITGIPTLTAAHSYTYSLTIGKKKASIGSVTVENWTTGNIIDDKGTTEEHLGYREVIEETDGTKTYIIEDAFGLMAVNRIMTSNTDELSSNITLAEHITLMGENNWTPIGNRNNPYTGIFDGNQKTITGLHIDNGSSDYQGLIGFLDGGTIKDLTLANSKITGKKYIGGVVGYLLGDYSITNVTVKDCAIVGESNAGGVIGYSGGNGTISGATLLDSKVTANWNVGGIVGDMASSRSYIKNCLVQSNTGKSVAIIANNSDAGGIAGRSSVPISGCKVINGGELTIRANNTDGYSGGIVSYSSGTDIIACLVQEANVTATTVGGIVGKYSGYNLYGSYAYNCTTGETPEAFTGTANVVGEIGKQYSEVSSCYYHAYNDNAFGELVIPVSNSSGNLETDTPVDWNTAYGTMNTYLNSYGYVWDGTYDAPTLTAI